MIALEALESFDSGFVFEVLSGKGVDSVRWYVERHVAYNWNNNNSFSLLNTKNELIEVLLGQWLGVRDPEDHLHDIKFHWSQVWVDALILD